MSLPNEDDVTTQEGAAPARTGDEEHHVSGGDPGRMDAAPGSGGMPAAGADGQTAAREQLRKDLGERPAGAGEDTASPLEQGPLGATDDPGDASLQD